MNNPKRMKLQIEDDDKNAVLYPVLSDDLIEETPLIDVYIDRIKDLKTISQIIIQLNTIVPIPELMHLKRVRGKDILLFPTNYTQNNIENVYKLLQEKSFDTKNLDNNIRKVQVAKIPPKVRKQYEIVKNFWPCNFHSNKYLEKLSNNTIFSSNELNLHINYMKIAIEIAKLSTKNVGVIVVDPKVNCIVAIGFDQSNDYPNKHAVFVAVDNVAKTQNGGVWLNNNDSLNDNDLLIDYRGIPRNYLEILQKQFSNVKWGLEKCRKKEDNNDGPYLCTDYYLYTTHEPCIMCSMALIHSRIKRVFYGIKSNRGALGTLCKVHVIENLNHHYEVFAGLLEDQCKQLHIIR